MFGTDQSTALSRSTLERIFLNFEAPSQCRGNVTSWRFCFYEPTDDDYDNNDDFGAKFIIYRKESPTSSNYLPVPGSIREKIIDYRDIRSSFGCMEEILGQDDEFEIQENDVLAACIWDKSSVNPLYLLGRNNNLNEKLYQVDRRGYDDCTTAQISTVDTSHSKFTLRDNYKLHLYVDVGTLLCHFIIVACIIIYWPHCTIKSKCGTKVPLVAYLHNFCSTNSASNNKHYYVDF